MCDADAFVCLCSTLFYDGRLVSKGENGNCLASGYDTPLDLFVKGKTIARDLEISGKYLF